MIRRFLFLRRADGLAPADFHAALAERHRALVAAAPAVCAGVLGWELLHRLAGDYARERHDAEQAEAGWDAVSVVSCRDAQALDAHEALFAGALAQHDISGLLAPDRIGVRTAAPTPIVIHPGGKEGAGLRLTAIVRRNRALSPADFHRHWREHHGGLYRQVPALADPVRAYEQNHGLDRPEDTHDGVTEQWFDSLEAWVDSIAVPEQAALVEPDVAYFLEAGATAYLLSGEATRLCGAS